jgi:hypothetical protein
MAACVPRRKRVGLSVSALTTGAEPLPEAGVLSADVAVEGRVVKVTGLPLPAP